MTPAQDGARGRRMLQAELLSKCHRVCCLRALHRESLLEDFCPSTFASMCCTACDADSERCTVYVLEPTEINARQSRRCKRHTHEFRPLFDQQVHSNNFLALDSVCLRDRPLRQETSSSYGSSSTLTPPDLLPATKSTRVCLTDPRHSENLRWSVVDAPKRGDNRGEKTRGWDIGLKRGSRNTERRHDGERSYNDEPFSTDG